MDTTIHINVADIPPEVGESFGRVTLAGFKKFIAQPGNREKLEAQMAACGSDYVKLQELTEEQAREKAALEEKLERWVYLTELAEKIAAQEG